MLGDAYSSKNFKVLCSTYHQVEIGFLFGTAGSLESGTLHLGADHLIAEEWLAAKEEFVVVAATVITTSDAVESI